MPVSTTPNHRSHLLSLPTELIVQILKDEQLELLDLASCCFVNRLFRSIALPRLPLDTEPNLVLITDEADDSRNWYFNESSHPTIDVIERFPPLGQLVTSASLFQLYSDLLYWQLRLPNETTKSLTQEEKEEELAAFAEAVEDAEFDWKLEDTIPAKKTDVWDTDCAVEWCLDMMPNLTSFEFGVDVWSSVENLITEKRRYQRRWKVEKVDSHSTRIVRRDLVK